MAYNYSEKQAIPYSNDQQQLDVDYNMFFHNARTPPPPAYDEKMPTTAHSQFLEKEPFVDDKELSPTPSASNSNADDLEITPTLANGGKQMKFHHAGFPWRAVNITSTSGQPLYHAEISEATPKKPDVLLRAPDKNGASVARSHFRLSRSMRVGIGQREVDTDWVELNTSAVFSKGSYGFTYGGREYRLSRTKASEHGVEGMNKANLNNFKVVEVGGSEEVIAVYVSETWHPGWMKGVLTLREGVSGQLELLVVMGVVGWREKMRRRAAYSGSGGNGGGGG